MQHLYYILLLFAASNIAYGMEVKKLQDLFNQEKNEVVFEGTRYKLDGPYYKTKPLADNSASEYMVTLQQTNGWLQNKKIIVSRTSVTGQFKPPKIKRRSCTYTTLSYTLTGISLCGLTAYLLMKDE